MKKILVVVTDLNLGGVTTSVINFCNELSSRGESVHFLNMGMNDNAVISQMNPSIKHLRLMGLQKRWNLGAKTLKTTSGLEKMSLYPLVVIKKLTNRSEKWLNVVFHNYCIPKEYDAVVAFRQCAPCYYFALNCVNAKKKIGFIHGALEHMGDISTWDRYFPELDKIACVSKACCEEFRNKYVEQKDRFAYVYNMFPIDDIRKKAKEEPNIVFSPEKFNIVTVSRIENATKGTDRIASVCKMLKDEGLSFHWYLLGDGPDMDYVVEEINQLEIEDVITLCGVQSNPHSYVKRADLSVLPTHTEAYSMTVIESLIVGTPMILTSYPGAEEAIQDGVNGFIVEQDDKALFEKIRQCILDIEKIEILKKSIFKKTISNDQAVNQFMSLIE